MRLNSSSYQVVYNKHILLTKFICLRSFLHIPLIGLRIKRKAGVGLPYRKDEGACIFQGLKKQFCTPYSVLRLPFKDVRAQKFPRTDFLKLWLQVENDKIRLKT